MGRGAGAVGETARRRPPGGPAGACAVHGTGPDDPLRADAGGGHARADATPHTSVPIPAVTSWRRPVASIASTTAGSASESMIPWRSMRLAYASGRICSSAGSRAPFSDSSSLVVRMAGMSSSAAARESEHVGLDLIARRCLDDALEHAGLVFGEQEDRGRRRE